MAMYSQQNMKVIFRNKDFQTVFQCVFIECLFSDTFPTKFQVHVTQQHFQIFTYGMWNEPTGPQISVLAFKRL